MDDCNLVRVYRRNRVVISTSDCRTAIQRGASNKLTFGSNGTSDEAAYDFNGVLLTNLKVSYKAQTSTTNGVLIAYDTYTWVDSTHASRKGRVVYNVYDTAAREAIRLEATGSAARIGFGGAIDSSYLVKLNGNMVITPTADDQSVLRINTSAGTRSMSFGTFSGDSSYAGLWLGSNAPSTTNFSFLANDSEIVFNGPPSGTMRFRIGQNSTVQLSFLADGTFSTSYTSKIGAPSLATTATDGFIYIPTCAGTPTGVPTAVTGMAPLVVDATNNKLYFYTGGAWRDAGP
jgi:hypothetical protein